MIHMVVGDIHSIAVNPYQSKRDCRPICELDSWMSVMMQVPRGADLIKVTLAPQPIFPGWQPQSIARRTTSVAAISYSIRRIQANWLRPQALEFSPRRPSTLPTSSNSPYVWTDQSLGIEQVVVQSDYCAARAAIRSIAVWDRGFFQIDNPDTYASSYGPVNGAFTEGWALDYASSDPSFVVGVAD